ncbi:MAG: hypothetical protein H6502_05545 [Candidatus Woesearchaeota archaeon]|nr:MAG: hypothetical protein H6502_05545 [Candidatus Woesearchaeota archaeon]
MHNTLEEELAVICPSCKTEHNATLSRAFHLEENYLVGNCGSCGYEIFYPVENGDDH